MVLLMFQIMELYHFILKTVFSISLAETSSIIGQRREKLAGGNIFFHFPLSLDSINLISFVDGDNIQQLSFGSVKQEVDFYIDQYQENSTYNQMGFWTTLFLL